MIGPWGHCSVGGRSNPNTEESIIKTEILRQIGKSINNSIGTLHEQAIGGIDGCEMGDLSGFDIKAKDSICSPI